MRLSKPSILTKFIMYSGIKRRAAMASIAFAFIMRYVYLRTKSCLPENWCNCIKYPILCSIVIWPLFMLLGKILSKSKLLRIIEFFKLYVYNYILILLYSFMMIFIYDALLFLDKYLPFFIPKYFYDHFDSVKPYLFIGTASIIGSLYLYGKYHWLQI